MKIGILIVSPHRVFCDTLALTFSLRNDFIVVNTARNVHAISDNREIGRAVILLLETPVFLEREYAAIEYLKQTYGIKTVIIQKIANAAEICDLISKGIRGFVSPASSLDTLTEALRKVFSEGHFFDPAISGPIAAGLQKKPDFKAKITNGPQFTEMEYNVLTGFCRGNTVSGLAMELGVSKRTIERCKKRLFVLYNVDSTNGLLISALKAGVLHLSKLI